MFKTQNFCHIASNNRNQVKVGVFVYRTTDDLATVLTSGYFNERIIDINLHDLIIHEKVDNADATKVQRNLLCVTERSLENVGTSVIKSKWEGDIEQDIADIEQEIAGLGNSFVKTDGSSVMTAPLKFSAGSMRGAVAPYLNGVSFWKMDSQGTITNIANLTDSQFFPVTTNSIDLGNTTHTWKDAYVARVITSVLNNGYDIAVPVTNSADTLALKSQIDLAANSGSQLYTTGVWYAKMYAATVVPTGAEYDGRNYADFSQVDSDNNPVIKIYTGASGAWTLTETITPPATYNGYMTITSKIWDIAEQSGQQGGQVLWDYTHKTFTPYPRIVSFDGANITNGTFQGTATLSGISTVTMPAVPSGNQIVNKDYVDAVTTSGYHPNLLDCKWADYILNDVQWLRADTFSWQDGGVYEAVYQHLEDEYNALPTTSSTDFDYNDNTYVRFPAEDHLSDSHPYAYANIYSYPVNIVYANEDYISMSGSDIYNGSGSSAINLGTVTSISTLTYRMPLLETIAGIKIMYYVAQDGHKIVLSGMESAVEAIYTATGVAWYYIIDVLNERFKLPRTKYGFTGLRNSVGNYVANNGASGSDIHATQMYLYFYVGSFTQSAIENTAGLNAELFNDKVDLASSWSAPNYAAKQSLTLGASGTEYTAASDGLYFIQFTNGAQNNHWVNIDINGDFMLNFWAQVANNSFGIPPIPVKKGDVLKITYGSDITGANTFYFVPVVKSN